MSVAPTTARPRFSDPHHLGPFVRCVGAVAGRVTKVSLRTAMDGLNLSRQRPRRRGRFWRAFPVGSLSDSSVGSPFGRTRSGSTSPLRSATVSVRAAAEEGCDGCGRPTCDAGGASRDPLLCECAPGANGTIIVGSSSSVAPNDPTDTDRVNAAVAAQRVSRWPIEHSPGRLDRWRALVAAGARQARLGAAQLLRVCARQARMALPPGPVLCSPIGPGGGCLAPYLADGDGDRSPVSPPSIYTKQNALMRA